MLNFLSSEITKFQLCSFTDFIDWSFKLANYGSSVNGFRLFFNIVLRIACIIFPM
jgi:hypothetical protein